MSTKDCFMKLYKAETEKEISELIKRLNMDNIKDWIPYGKNESNFSVIGNQSSNAERALIEKFTNCVDAVLMKKCYEMNLDPKGNNCPKSPSEALEVFFGLKNGDTSEITKEIERELGENILLMATNKDCMSTEKKSKSNPNMIIFDKGEGQTPNKLPDTILSLLKGNKKSIPFTQGNYNQGGSGALMYCGEKGYCLVISKRSVKIPDEFIDVDDNTREKWGWTLIRKEIRDDAKDPVYTYYAPNGQVPTIDEDELSLLPKELNNYESKKYLNYNGSCKGFIPYSEKVNCGTAIKLYNYKLAKKGPINGHLKYDLASYINDTYLPIRFVDCRKNKSSNSVYFRGFKKIIEENNIDEDNEKNGLVYNKIDVDFKIKEQEVLTHIYCCNKRPSSSLTASKLIEGSRAIKFCLGQQFQGGLTARFLNSAGLGAIQDLIIIIVEFPNISTEFRSNLFMTDRERLYDKAPKKAIEKKLKDIIEKSQELREFRKYIIKSSEDENDKDNKAIKEIMEEWVKKDPTVSELLLGNNNIFDKNIIISEGEDEEIEIDEPEESKKNNSKASKGNMKPKQENIDKKYYPTYLDPILRVDDAKIYHKIIYINEPFRIRFKTDAEDDFFTRSKNKGKIKVYVNGKEITDFSRIFENGKVTLIFSKNISGKKLQTKDMNISLEYNEKEYFHEIIQLKLIEKDKSKEKVKRTIGLPKYKISTKDNYVSGMDEESGVIYANDFGTYTYYINVDNISLKEKLNSLNDEVDKELYTQMYIYIMLFLAISINNKKDKSKETKDGITDTSKEIAMVTREYAKFMFIAEKLMDNLKEKIGK
ncbi:hypothetical protein QTH09_02485 [Clostridium perfringens]|uniref:hypothetical protein n=1 Tax=Clostridium perfringens TaxID=1502 RepID=UPI0022481445|nr:hypothetical protein [Clostridium perfringens]MDM0609898.1 hypothetical protein [Clostridium perfringens]